MSLCLGGGRVTQWRGPDIGFHEMGGKGGTKDCNLIFL